MLALGSVRSSRLGLSNQVRILVWSESIIPIISAGMLPLV